MPEDLCTHWISGESRRCLAPGTRMYLLGRRCPAHTPAALAGRPEPGQGAYCAPGRCLCGDDTCPAYATYALRDRYATAADSWAAVDARAIASGKRRSSPAQYAAAKTTVGEQHDRDARLRRTA
ncbi:hypothetical protein [Actinomadura sp. DC4]|uniref:hypothetical protein n=1 Tax=Actinomadura sp. DC4 TaxID=3055069 RepID=UPI0025B17284|nr:hypothetical protein [Actinomadura sp. DC4]MDN3356044.1 hypothetical protein [Actinomadura sp. DC4]